MCREPHGNGERINSTAGKFYNLFCINVFHSTEGPAFSGHWLCPIRNISQLSDSVRLCYVYGERLSVIVYTSRSVHSRNWSTQIHSCALFVYKTEKCFEKLCSNVGLYVSCTYRKQIILMHKTYIINLTTAPHSHMPCSCEQWSMGGNNHFNII